VEIPRQMIEEAKISNNLKRTLYMSFDKSELYLKIDYLKGKFTIEKTFQNNIDGLEKLETSKNELDEESKVKLYLKL
jgi:hypothetical protein